MTDYPFIVGHRLKKVRAPNYKNALDRVLYKNPNIFIKTKFAKRMDLITASEEAKKASKQKKNARFYVTSNIKTGEVDFSTFVKVTEMAQAVFVNGKMGKLTDEEKQQGKVPDKGVPPSTHTSGKVAPNIAKVREGMEQILASNKSLNKIIETGMKNAEKNKTKGAKLAPAKKSVPVKKANGETVHPRFRPIVGGAALDILNALKKKVCTKQELAKLAKTLDTNIVWYIGKIRNNGHKVEVTDKGYALKK